MSTTITPHTIFETLKEMSPENINEVWKFIKTVKSKQKDSSSNNIKLGGILSGYDIDLSEDEINKARKEMWQNLGELNE